MATESTQTKWIVIAVVLVVVSVVAAAVLIATALGGPDETREVTTTTESPTTTPTVTSTTRPGGDRPTTTEPSNIDVEKVTVSVGGADRTYTVIAPSDVSDDEQLPVVVALHGLGVNSAAMSRGADWRGAVARDRFIAVFPQGIADSWNLGVCCPPANLLKAADQAFLDEVVGAMSARPDVDAERLYMTGFSNGALMVYAYACARPGVLAAIAPMAGTNLTGCSPSPPLSLLHQHSDPDLVVPYDGGPALGQLLSSTPFPPVPDSVAAWAAADGCDPNPESSTDADAVERFVWSGCSDGTSVELIRIPGTGHAWPKKGAYDPLAEILRFFDLD